MSRPATHRRDAVCCPYCGEHVNAHTNLGKDVRGPSVGDFTVCKHCGGFSMFDEGLRLVMVTDSNFNQADVEDNDRKAMYDFRNAVRQGRVQ